MWVCLVLNLLLLPQTPKPTLPAVPKPPELVQSQVVVQDRSILLPALPENVDEARRGYKDAHARIIQANKDLEEILLALYGSKGAEDPLPPSLTLTDEETKEAESLVQMNRDTRAAVQEKAVLDVWNAWMAVLRENGLADPAAASSKAAPTAASQVAPGKEKEYEELKKKLSRMDPQFWANQSDPITHSNYWELDDVYDHEGYDMNVAQAARHSVVVKWMGPQFALAWEPLREHLQVYSTQLQALERQPSAARNPGLELLRLKTKIQHIERFRAALWFCDVVWSQMASTKPPPPLKRIRPQPQN